MAIDHVPTTGDLFYKNMGQDVALSFLSRIIRRPATRSKKRAQQDQGAETDLNGNPVSSSSTAEAGAEAEPALPGAEASEASVIPAVETAEASWAEGIADMGEV